MPGRSRTLLRRISVRGRGSNQHADKPPTIEPTPPPAAAASAAAAATGDAPAFRDESDSPWRNGVHRDTNSYLGPDGFSQDGLDAHGFRRDGTFGKYAAQGYVSPYGEHHDDYGFSVYGIHKVTGTQFDPDGYDWDRLDVNGFDDEGYHCSTGEKVNPEGYTSNGDYVGPPQRIMGCLHDGAHD